MYSIENSIESLLENFASIYHDQCLKLDPVVMESQTLRQIRHRNERQRSERNDLELTGQLVGTIQGGNLTEEQKSTQERFKRVQAKLDGTDFDPKKPLSVKDQVDRLIYEAQNIENLCQHYGGWCIHW